MQILRRPETAQGRFGFSESGHSGRTETRDREVARAARKIRGERYFTAVFELIDLFAEASEEANGEAVDVRAFAGARDLLDALPQGFEVPEIGIDPGGEVAFDWIRPERTMVSVSIGADDDLVYAARLRDGTAHGVIRRGDGFPGALTALLRRLFHPA